MLADSDSMLKSMSEERQSGAGARRSREVVSLNEAFYLWEAAGAVVIMEQNPEG
jgi:hypothetical protein